MRPREDEIDVVLGLVEKGGFSGKACVLDSSEGPLKKILLFRSQPVENRSPHLHNDPSHLSVLRGIMDMCAFVEDGEKGGEGRSRRDWRWKSVERGERKAGREREIRESESTEREGGRKEGLPSRTKHTDKGRRSKLAATATILDRCRSRLGIPFILPQVARFSHRSDVPFDGTK